MQKGETMPEIVKAIIAPEKGCYLDEITTNKLSGNKLHSLFKNGEYDSEYWWFIKENYNSIVF